MIYLFSQILFIYHIYISNPLQILLINISRRKLAQPFTRRRCTAKKTWWPICLDMVRTCWCSVDVVLDVVLVFCRTASGISGSHVPDKRLVHPNPNFGSGTRNDALNDDLTRTIKQKVSAKASKMSFQWDFVGWIRNKHDIKLQHSL